MNVEKLNVESTKCSIGILGNWLDGKSQMFNWLFVQYFLVNVTCSNAFVGSTGHLPPTSSRHLISLLKLVRDLKRNDMKPSTGQNDCQQLKWHPFAPHLWTFFDITIQTLHNFWNQAPIRCRDGKLRLETSLSRTTFRLIVLRPATDVALPLN